MDWFGTWENSIEGKGLMTLAVLFPPLYWGRSYLKTRYSPAVAPEVLKLHKRRLFLLVPVAIFLLGDIWKKELGLGSKNNEDQLWRDMMEKKQKETIEVEQR
jgi:hypothetical protein